MTRANMCRKSVNSVVLPRSRHRCAVEVQRRLLLCSVHVSVESERSNEQIRVTIFEFPDQARYEISGTGSDVFGAYSQLRRSC
jgi:hypothetical protein